MLQSQHKQKVRELATDFVDIYNAREPLDLANAIGVRLEYGDLGDKDGAFDPERNVVFLSKKSSPERQRFTMAHEVTHFLILADDEFLSDLHDAYEGDELEENIEVLCNIGASAILVPQDQLEILLKRYGQSARAVAKITQQFGISKPAACVIMAEQITETAVVAVQAVGVDPAAGGRGGRIAGGVAPVVAIGLAAVGRADETVHDERAADAPRVSRRFLSR